MTEINSLDFGRTASVPLYGLGIWLLVAIRYKAKQLEICSSDNWRTVSGPIIVNDSGSLPISPIDPTIGTAPPWVFENNIFVSEVVQHLSDDDVVVLRINDRMFSIRVVFVSRAGSEAIQFHFGSDTNDIIADEILEKIVFDRHKKGSEQRRALYIEFLLLKIFWAVVVSSVVIAIIILLIFADSW